MLFELVKPDSFEFEDEDEYCVKIGHVPGGCQVQECQDIDHCPYLKNKEISLNPSE